MPSTPSGTAPVTPVEPNVSEAGDTERPPPPRAPPRSPTAPAIRQVRPAAAPPSSGRVVVAPPKPSTPRVQTASVARPLVERPVTPELAFARGGAVVPAARAPAAPNTVPAPPPSDPSTVGDLIAEELAAASSSAGEGEGAPVPASAPNAAPLSGQTGPTAPEEAASPNVPLTRRCATCDERYPGDFLVCPRDATPLQDETGEHQVDPLLGKLLGETYQIVRVVGEGGMGRVYEARHLRLKQRRYAVKTLHAELARNVEMAARFMREAEAVSGLDHPNVVDVFDVHHLPDGTPYLVGEFLEGEELADYVDNRGALDPYLAANVAAQVCAALGAAHARGIVHRDMKPENIFVLKSSIDALAAGEAKSLVVKVLDFGISKSGGGERTHLTKTGVIMGTPSYMAPEQARGRQVDHRADVYSVGACLYFMITGLRPFDSDDPTSTISMVLTQDPQRPREIDARIPEGLELIVQRAMAKEAQDRYPTMAELEGALRTFQAARLVSARAMTVNVEDAVDLRQTGTQRAFDAMHAVLGSGSIAPSSPTSSREARLARPVVVAASAALAFWFLGGTAAALGGLVRVLHEGEITVTESVLLLVGCLFAASTPMGIYVVHVRRRIWPNSVRAVALASDLKRTTAAAFISYGALTLLNRLAHTVVLRSSPRLASGVWDISMFVISVVAALTIGGLGPLVRNVRRRRASE